MLRNNEINIRDPFILTENGKYYISDTFALFQDNIINGNVSRDVFQSVNKYFHDVISKDPDCSSVLII